MLKQFLAQNPNDAFARYGLAMEYARAGDVGAELREFQTIQETNPDYVAAYQQAAQTLMTAERFDEARAMLEKGIACAQRTGNAHARSEMQAMLDEIG